MNVVCARACSENPGLLNGKCLLYSLLWGPGSRLRITVLSTFTLSRSFRHAASLGFSCHTCTKLELNPVFPLAPADSISPPQPPPKATPFGAPVSHKFELRCCKLDSSPRLASSNFFRNHFVSLRSSLSPHRDLTTQHRA